MGGLNMITIKEDTTLVGVSELRSGLEAILEESKKHKVLIGRRNKPIAVLIDIERYKEMEAVIELVEDFTLGFLAKERDKSSKSSDYITLEEALKKLKK